MKKRFALLMALAMICMVAALVGCRQGSTGNAAVSENSTKNSTANVEKVSIVYENTEYGFRFSLPDSWKDYTIVTDTWKGLATGNSQGEKVVETGPMISIRNPEWTPEKAQQDIPIMIFTLKQWDSMNKEDAFHIGAAPIGPSELARNSKYIFALPARYNFAFPDGYEEVETILKGNPLKPIEDINPK